MSSQKLIQRSTISQPSGILRIHFCLRCLKETKGHKSEQHSSRPISLLSNCLVLRAVHAKCPDSHHQQLCSFPPLLPELLVLPGLQCITSVISPVSSLSFHIPPFLLAMQLPLSTVSCPKPQSLWNLIGKDPWDGAMGQRRRKHKSDT